MSHEALIQRRLPNDQLSLRLGWKLLAFLLSLGADEFSLRFIYVGDGNKPACDRLIEQLSAFSLGYKTRETTVTYAGEASSRSIEVWRLNEQSVESLQQLLPNGLLSEDLTVDARAED